MSPRLRLITFAALIGGIVLRALPLAAYPSGPLGGCDGRAYFVIGMAWARGLGLYVDDPGLAEYCAHGVEIGPSHHWAPALPIIEGSFFLLLGDATLALVLPLLLISGLAVGVVWWTTRDLYGQDAALLAAAAASLEWTGALYGTWLGYSENLVVIVLALALWAVLRSLRDDRYVLAAGLFAGLGYLSKASIGGFFLIAGLGGLARRLWFRGRSVLRNRWYVAAIAIFAVPVVIWSWRNISLFWDGTPLGLLGAWQTSGVVGLLVADALRQPDALLIGLAGKLPILLVGLALPFLPLLRGFAAPVRGWRDEETLGPWLTVGLILVLGWVFAAVFWVGVGTSLAWGDRIRYVMPAQVPLLWLLLRQGGPFSTRAWSLSYLILAVMVLAMPLLLTAGPLAIGSSLVPRP